MQGLAGFSKDRNAEPGPKTQAAYGFGLALSKAPICIEGVEVEGLSLGFGPTEWGASRRCFKS